MIFVEIISHPIMLWLGRLRVDKVLDPAEEVRTELMHLLDNFTQLLKNNDWPAQAIDDARYAICAGLDEAAMNRADFFSDTWSANPLQLSLFDDYTAGNGFYVRLDKLRKNPKQNALVMGIFWAVLCHGFCGKLSLAPVKDKMKLTDDIRREFEPHLPGIPPKYPAFHKRSWRFPWLSLLRWITPAACAASVLVISLTIVNEYQRSEQLKSLIEQTMAKEQ